MGRATAIAQEIVGRDVARRGAAPRTNVHPLPGLGQDLVGDLSEVEELLWDAQVASAVEPLALIDRLGRVLRTTPSFQRLTGEGDGLLIRHRQLCAVDDEAQPALQRAVSAATRRDAPTCASLRCPRASGRAPLILTLRPLPETGRLLSAGRTAVLSAVDPGRRPEGAVALWQEAFALTRAEADLAGLLMAGHSVESASATRNCRPTTLRVHLRHLFAKVGVTRQTDLVALLARVR